MTHSCWDIVAAWSWSEGLLDHSVLLLRSEGACNSNSWIHRWVDRRLVVSWTWVHVGLGHAQVVSCRCSDEVRDVGVVDWNLVRLVLSWSRLVQVLSRVSLWLLAHVELGVLECLIELSFDLVLARSWHVLVGLYEILPLGLSKSLIWDVALVIWFAEVTVLMVGINRVIPLRTKWILVVVRVLAAFRHWQLDLEAWWRILREGTVGTRARVVNLI